jgi:hypothetical protein
MDFHCRRDKFYAKNYQFVSEYLDNELSTRILENAIKRRRANVIIQVIIHL